MKSLRRFIMHIPASLPSHPPKGNCTPCPAGLSGSPSRPPQQSCCSPEEIWLEGKVSWGAFSCWLNCGCVSGSPNKDWSYNPGSGPLLWVVHRWRSSCCHLYKSHRREHGLAQSAPCHDFSSAPDGGAPFHSGHIASCRIHHIQTQPHLNHHRRNSPDTIILCSFLYLQLDLDHSS